MNKINSTQRQPWLDIIRGICAIMVVLSHVTSTPLIYGVFYSPIMISAFFLVSGYLSKNYDGSVLKFLYNRVLKLVIAYLIIILFDKLLLVSNIPIILNDPKYLLKMAADYCNYIFYGYDLWFVPCLVCVSIYFIIVNKICRYKPLPMFIMSAVIAAIGLYINQPDEFVNWHAHTALVCLFFYMTGYCVKKKKWIDNYNFTVKSCILSGGAYLAAIIVFSLIFGMENIFIVAANNEWQILPVTALLMLLGVWFIICLSKKIPSCKLLEYIGAHSLIYFAFGSRCMAFFQRSTENMEMPVLGNPYIKSILLTVCGCLMTLIVCKLSDKFFPPLNGNIRLPELKSKKTDA